ncbi:hypothetical protein NDU88_005679 [Pleurodeles waltl]|uniref:Uncharacterized protein n=1 Tax=Pleurodeles waltl TaxID=8319 RepID=A0AAV7TXV0_PLEWA|nr:hypothetical protein NDU88_005679 [Pleurodeles waltl]
MGNFGADSAETGGKERELRPKRQRGWASAEVPPSREVNGAWEDPRPPEDQSSVGGPRVCPALPQSGQPVGQTAEEHRSGAGRKENIAALQVTERCAGVECPHAEQPSRRYGGAGGAVELKGNINSTSFPFQRRAGTRAGQKADCLVTFTEGLRCRTDPGKPERDPAGSRHQGNQE